MKPEQSRSENTETKPLINCATIKAEPSLTPELFEAMTNGAESIVITAFASGTVPERIIPIIKSRVDSGVPVFLVSNNPADSHGIERLKYQPQVNVAEAGATALKNVNANNIADVLKAIQEETAQGKKGSELGKAIGERFGIAGNK